MFKMPDQPEKIIDNMIKQGIPEDDVLKFAMEVAGDPLKYFCPNGVQEKIIKAFAEAYDNSGISVVLATNANGVGKTTIAKHIIANLVYGAQNGWFDYPVFKRFKFPKLIWIVSTGTSLKDNIIPAFQDGDERIFKEGTYTMHKEGKPYESMVKFNNGWRIKFFTNDQDVKQFESATVGVIIADEPIGEPIYKALKSRRRKGNIMFMPMTPLDCEPYVIDDIVSKVGSKRHFHVEGSVYEVSTIDNTAEGGQHCGVRGHLTPEVIDSMVEDYDIEEKEARVYGRFMYFSERIWQNFKDDITIVRPENFPIDPKKDKIFHVADPHDGRPCASVYFALKENGRVIAFSETPTDKNRPFWEIKEQVHIDNEVYTWNEIEEIFGLQGIKRIIDKRFGFQTRGGTNLANLISEAGRKLGKTFSFTPSYKNDSDMGELAYGHKIVRSFLEPMDDGYSKLVIWDSCGHLINGMKHYIRKKQKTVTELNKLPDESKIIEKYKDFNDVLRYALVAIYNYSSIIEARAKKPKRTRIYNRDPLKAVMC